MGKVKEQMIEDEHKTTDESDSNGGGAGNAQGRGQIAQDGDDRGPAPSMQKAPEDGEYVEDKSPEQEINVGDKVRVYDSRLTWSADGVVLYAKEVDETRVLSVQCHWYGENKLLQVAELQCRRLDRRAARTLWLRWNGKGYDIAAEAQREEGWFRVKEELDK